MIKGDQRKHAVQYIEWFYLGGGFPLSVGTLKDYGLRNALNVKMLPLHLSVDYFLGTLITLPFK